MNQLSFTDVSITKGFWADRQKQNREATVYAVRDRFLETGRFTAFKCSWKEGDPNKPHIFWDSDIAKWIESVAYAFQKDMPADLQGLIEEVIDDIQQNSDTNGYFNIYFTVCEPESRFQRRTDHELYCAGHLIEAAVAYYNATGRDRFLKLMCKYANYIETVFVKEDSANFRTPGHEEIELALVKLYHCTGEKRYLNLARFFIDQRGANHKDIGKEYDFAEPSYSQSHLPVRDLREATGHSVRACYLYAAMADLARELHDEGLLTACKALFQDIVTNKMYITGGVGQSHMGEAFTIPYDLPGRNAYAETCAAISLAYFAERLLSLEADSRYADLVERLLYNGILSGISLDGTSFFYENPLEINPALNHRDVSVTPAHRSRAPITQRVKVFECSCCPPNISRLLATIGDYLYGVQDDTYFVHQYTESVYEKGVVRIAQQTEYPKSGQVKLTAKGVKTLAIRIPGWCNDYSISAPHTVKSGYAYIQNPGEITVDFKMEPVFMQSSPHVAENAGRVAVQLGPVVYCAESVDNGGDLKNIVIDSETAFRVVYDPFFGANTIGLDAYRPTKTDALYSCYSQEMRRTSLSLIPYYAFANRGEAEMLVWLLIH